MGNKIKTIGLLLIVGFLLVTTVYVSLQLRKDSTSAPTTVHQTKAATKTYSTTVSLNSSAVTPTQRVLSPTATSAQPSLAQGNQSSSAIVVLTPTSMVDASPGTILISPTSIPTVTSSLLAQATTVIPTPSSFASAQGVSPTVNLTPTETLLAKVTSTPTINPLTTITPTKTQSLPDAGWMKPMHLLFIFAFSLVFFSLLY